jgi:hypothetical protein
MGTRAAWLPGSGLAQLANHAGPGKKYHKLPNAAFGGHVYSQAGLAVCHVVEEEEKKRGPNPKGKLGLHVRSSPRTVDCNDTDKTARQSTATSLL